MVSRFLIVVSLFCLFSGCSQPKQDSANLPVLTEPDMASSSQPSESPRLIGAPTDSGISIAEAAQLTSSQVEELMRLAEQAKQKQPGRDFKIIVPTYLSGFQVDKVTTALTGTPGAPEYKIVYRNPSSSSCFSIDASSSGWGAGEVEHQDVPVFSEALGIVVLSTLKFDNESHSSTIQWRDGPIIRSGRGYFFGSGQGQNCETMNFQEAVKVVESLQYMDSPQTKAKPLDKIEKDADRLVNKFNFPLDSCGDPPSGSNDRWYPVFMDGTDGGQEYCKDAVVKEVKSKWESFRKIQVGSFTSYERASEFAKAVGGRVGEPDN